MHKNNLIRFAESLVLFPLLTGVLPIGTNFQVSKEMPIQTVFIQKNTLETKIAEPEDKTILIQAKAIDDYFKSYDMPLFGMGKKMAEEAKKNNIDWRILPAISMRESTGGKAKCIRVKNNAFGWGSCKIGFESNEEAIETVARNLGGNNPNTAKFYADKTLKEILRSYNPPHIVPRYAEQVISIMDKIGNEKVENLDY